MASSSLINQWNEKWRSSPEYARIYQQVGARPGQPLSDQQRKQVQMMAEQAFGMKFPKGVEIDPAGNMNENEGFGKQAKRYGPIVGAGALAAFGIPGLFPGLLTSGPAAAGAAGSGVTGTTAGGAPIFANAGAQTAGMLSPAAWAAGAGAGLKGLDIIKNATGGGGSPWRTVLESLMKYGPTALAGGAAIKGMTQGPTDAEKQLAQILQMAQGRMQQSEPLFQALNRMTMAQLPKYARGEE